MYNQLNIFSSRDLYEYNSVCTVRLADGIYVYIWQPIIELDKLLNGGKTELLPCYKVNDHTVSEVKHKCMVEVKRVLDIYSKWLQTKNEFCNGNIKAVVPIVTNEVADYWKMFCDVLYINSYTKFCKVLQNIRSQCITAENFKDSLNTVIMQYLRIELSTIDVDAFLIQSLCDNKYTSGEQYGLMYWWLEPYMRIEYNIKVLKQNVQKGLYDKIII